MAFGLNIFKTVTFDIGTTVSEIYTAPALYSAIVLSAQITNVTGSTALATMSVLAEDSTETELIKDFAIPPNDASSALVGKLVLETGYGLTVVASTNDTLKITLSILESKN
jgi:hypothetical protein